MENLIRRVQAIPQIPRPFAMRSWKTVAQRYDAFVFNDELRGQYLPLVAWDREQPHFQVEAFRLPSYVGQDARGEAINQIAAVVGGSLVGIDKSDQNGRNWVLMCSQYYNPDTRLVNNNMARESKSAGSFWYQILPCILFYQLVSLYPQMSKKQILTSDGSASLCMEEMMYLNAERFCQAAEVLGDGAEGYLWTGFDFSHMKPVFNGRWREPDAAAGIAWLEYMAYVKFGSRQFLHAAEMALQSLVSMDYNPLYELLLIYGAYLAARINAELGRDYDLSKLINWCFEPSDARDGWGRPGWGIIAENWAGLDAYGLQGSVTDSGGYAFAMNTFQWAGILLPLVRYDQRYAAQIGKWILNLANNARLFYSIYHSPQHQSNSSWDLDPHSCIAYEGLRKQGPITVPVEQQVSPYATGDAVRCGWGPTNYCLYGSSHVGYLAAPLGFTDDPGILELDLCVTDFFKGEAYPTYLYYNPYAEVRLITINVGEDPVDLYDTVTHSFLAVQASGREIVSIPPDQAVVLVLVPSGAEKAVSGQKLLCGGVVVDYHWGE